MRAYRLSDGARLSGKDIGDGGLTAGNSYPAGLWSDGTTLWVVDNVASKMFTYRLSDGARVADKEYAVRAANGASYFPWGLWSDGETALITDYGKARVLVHGLADGQSRPREVETEDYPLGLWSDGTTLWVVSEGDARIRAYAVPGLGAPLSASLSPFDVRVVTRADTVPGGEAAGAPVLLGDGALRGAIGEALGLGPEEAVGAEALRALRALNVRGRGVADLAGLEHAANLEELDLGRNPVADLWVLGMLPRLRVLNLDGAARDLRPLAALTGLERLSLRANGLEDVGVLAGLTNLRQLSLGNNALRGVGTLSGLRKLELLDVSENRLEEVEGLSGLTGLRALSLRDNRVRAVGALSGLGVLQRLDLGENEVEDLGPLQLLRSLESLEVDGNPGAASPGAGAHPPE